MKRPQILGIVNCTTDSFSDGGLFLDYDKALAQAVYLAEHGADIIDLGAASSNVKSGTVSTEVEIERLQPLMSALTARNIEFSIDTFNPAVQKFCLQETISYLNDIQGFPFPEIYPDLAKSNCKIIVMHSVQRKGAATLVKTDPLAVWDSMLAFFEERLSDLARAGISEERIIIDPGMGHFLGSNPESSMYALRNIGKLKKTFGQPVLIGVSRKSFLGNLCGCEATQRGAATLAAEIFACTQEVDYIRTHDTRALNDALTIWESLQT